MVTTQQETQTEPRIFILLGIPFHDITLQETLAAVDRIIKTGEPSYLLAANLDFAAEAKRDVELQRIAFDARVVLCDGPSLARAAEKLGTPLRERVAGPGFLAALFSHAAKQGYRVFLAGHSADLLEKVVAKCASEFPSLVICGTAALDQAKILESDDQETLERIRKAAPQILLVSMPSPAQEKWVYKHLHDLTVPLFIPMGSALDALAGVSVKRGAGWRSALEMFFFVRALAKQKLLLSKEKVAALPAGRNEVSPWVNVIQYSWSGRIDAAAVSEKSVTAVTPDAERPNVALDCSHVTFIDSTGLGLFIKTFRMCKELGGAFVVANPSDIVTKMLSVMELDRLIPIARTEEEIERYLKGGSKGKPQLASFDASTSTLTVPLMGDITAATVSACEAFLTTMWDRTPQASHLQLDLAKVAFIDSSGLGLLIKAFKVARQRAGAKMSIANPSPNVRNVISLANMGGMLGMTD